MHERHGRKAECCVHVCHTCMHTCVQWSRGLLFWQREGGRETGREGGRMYVSVVEAFLVSVGGAALNSLPYVVADDLLTFWITMLC